jgi:peptide chain release factor 1
MNPYQSQLDHLQQRIAEAEVLVQDPELGQIAQQESQELVKQLAEMQAAAEAYEQTLAMAGGSSIDSAQLRPLKCVLEFRPGAGGDEAKIWAGELLRMYIRYAERVGLAFTLLEELSLEIKGKVQVASTGDTGRTGTVNTLETEQSLTVYELLRFESGVHRVQRVPTTEAQNHIHTSTASVAVIPEVAPTAVSIVAFSSLVAGPFFTFE